MNRKAVCSLVDFKKLIAFICKRVNSSQPAWQQWDGSVIYWQTSPAKCHFAFVIRNSAWARRAFWNEDVDWFLFFFIVGWNFVTWCRVFWQASLHPFVLEIDAPLMLTFVFQWWRDKIFHSHLAEQWGPSLGLHGCLCCWSCLFFPHIITLIIMQGCRFSFCHWEGHILRRGCEGDPLRKLWASNT